PTQTAQPRIPELEEESVYPPWGRSRVIEARLQAVPEPHATGLHAGDRRTLRRRPLGSRFGCGDPGVWRTGNCRMVAPDSLFVGRERELEVLTAGLRDARGGRTRFLVVTGDAGIGKTRTVEELVRHAELPAGRVLWGRAPEQTGAPSYWPWIRALEGYAANANGALREEMGSDAPVLAYLVPARRLRCPAI